MPENAVPENRCGRLGRNDTRGGHRGGRGRPRTSANETHWPGRTKAARPFLLTKARGDGSANETASRPRERDNDRYHAARDRRRPRERAHSRERDRTTPRQTPPGAAQWPPAPANERERADTRRRANGPANGPTLAEATRANEPGRRRDAREREASRRRPRRPRERDPPGGASARTRRQAPAGADERGRPRTRSAPWPRAGGGRQILQDDDAGAPPPRRRSYHGRGRRAAQKRGICRYCVGIRRRPRLHARQYILTPTTTPREGNDDGKHQRIQGRAAQVLFPHG